MVILESQSEKSLIGILRQYTYKQILNGNGQLDAEI